MVEKELIKIFANHNNYIVGYEEKNKKKYKKKKFLKLQK